MADQQMLRTQLFRAAVVVGCCATCLGADQDAVATWSARAESFRRQVQNEDDAALVDAALAVMYAQQGDAEKSLSAARRVIDSNSKPALSQLTDVANMVTEHLGEEAADELLRSIKDPAQRKRATLRVFGAQGAAGKLAAARRHARLLESVDDRNEAWGWFILGSPSIDTARAALREIEAQNDEQRQSLAGLEAMIQRRSQKLKENPLTAEQLWEKAQTSNGSSHWRAAATAYLKSGDRTKCRDGLARSEAVGESIDLYSIKVANLTLIAHAYLEMDDSKEAARVAKKALQVMEDAAVKDEAEEGATFDLERALGGLMISPPLMNILARCGELDLALKYAEPSGQWIALGTGCVSDGLQTQLQSRLPKIDSPRDKALVCIGVVQGVLQEQKEDKETTQ